MRSVYLLFMMAGALGVGAAILGWYGLVQPDVLHREPQFIAAAGFLAAAAGWMTNNAVSLMLKVRERSLDYMGEVAARANQSATLNKLWLTYNIDDLIKNKERLTAFYIGNFLDHEFFNAMRQMANSYEDMAVAVLKGAVDEDMLLRSFGTSLAWFWPRLLPFLALYRNDPPIPGNPRGPEPAPKLFSHVEELAERWRGREK